MVPRLLLYIKHNIKFLWHIIEAVNSILFSIFHKNKFINNVDKVIDDTAAEAFTVRVLSLSDIDLLSDMIAKQNVADLQFFNPHGFDKKSLISAYKNPAFIMMGIFEKGKMIGYFFLRCFWNRKCFVGRLVDKDYRGKGVGKIMNQVMYNIAWSSGFKCLSTISKNNKAVMSAHAKNPTMIVLKELQNDFLLVEFSQAANNN